MEGMISWNDLIQTVILIFGTGFAWIQIRITRKENLSKYTMDFITKVLDSDSRREFESKNHVMASNHAQAVPCLLPNKDITLLKSILSDYEFLAVFVKYKRLDEAILLETIAPIMIQYWNWSYPYIDQRRNQGYSTLYHQYEQLISTWEYIRSQKDIQNKIKGKTPITQRDINKYRKCYDRSKSSVSSNPKQGLNS